MQCTHTHTHTENEIVWERPHTGAHSQGFENMAAFLREKNIIGMLRLRSIYVMKDV